MRNSSLKRSGTACVNEGSHSCTCHPKCTISVFTAQPQSLVQQHRLQRCHVRIYKFGVILTITTDSICVSELHSLVFSERELPSVCRLSVCNVRAPYSAGSNFRRYLYGIRYHWKFDGDRPRGTPPPGELNTRGVAKYSDFGPIEGYISETVQDTR